MVLILLPYTMIREDLNGLESFTIDCISYDFSTMNCLQLWELEREKKLILEGKMGVDDAPYIADHPVFKVSKMINSILDEKKEKVGEHHKKFEYIRQF